MRFYLAMALAAIAHTSECLTSPSPSRINRHHSLSLSMSSGGASSAVESSDAPPLRAAKPRKVCLMVEPTPFTHVSGYANRFNEMLRYLSKAGDKVQVLTTDDLKTKDGSEISTEKVLPKEAFGFPIEHTMGFRFPLYNHIVLSFDLPELRGMRMLDKFKPDIIHATSPGFLCYAALLYGRIMRVPVLLSYHTHLPVYARNYLSHPWFIELAWKLIRFVHNRADLTLVTSPQIRDELVEEGVERVDVWRKGIDTVRFQPSFKDDEMRNRMTDGHPDDFLMVYIGRVGVEKRLKDIRDMQARIPGARLCIVGGGPQEAELHKYFEGTNTVFTGQIRGDDLSKAFASADVFVMPSDSETLGFVVLESMASGVPVVGARAGGIQNLIKDGEDGFLCEVGNTDMYVDRLMQLKENLELRKAMGKASRREAERWSWEAATSVLRNIQYERALVNFHMRAFGGFGKPRSGGAWRLFKFRLVRLLAFLKIPQFGKKLEQVP